jgi:hypothetical protein
MKLTFGTLARRLNSALPMDSCGYYLSDLNSGSV